MRESRGHCARRKETAPESPAGGGDDGGAGAEKGERRAERLGYRSGYYSRCLISRVGTLELKVPQDRQGRFSTELFERYQRSEKALVSTLIEMYVQGVSTRKVKAVTEELCGHSFSASARRTRTG